MTTTKKNDKGASIRICTNCGSGALVWLMSIDSKICSECATVIPWNLADGQKSLLIDGKVGGIENG